MLNGDSEPTSALPAAPCWVLPKAQEGDGQACRVRRDTAIPPDSCSNPPDSSSASSPRQQLFALVVAIGFQFAVFPIFTQLASLLPPWRHSKRRPASTPSMGLGPSLLNGTLPPSILDIYTWIASTSSFSPKPWGWPPSSAVAALVYIHRLFFPFQFSSQQFFIRG